MVTVRSKVSIIDDTTGAEIVPADTIGTVIGVQKPPQKLSFNVTFTLTSGPVSVWVTELQLSFQDGPIGIVKTIFDDASETLETISNPRILSDVDFIIDDQLEAFRGEAKLKFVSGLTLNITSDRNTGDLTYVVGFE